MEENSNTDINSSEAMILADIYTFLALTMRYPESSFFNKEFLDAFTGLLTSYEMDSELAEIQNSCQAENEQELLESLQIEYTRLFINAAPHIIAPPYGSFYLDGDRNLQGKSTAKTRDFYRQYGCDITDPAEPADHIRFELEFLAAMARDNELDAEDTFVTTIFRPWFIQFKKRVLEDKVHPFYRVSVQLIDFFTKEEQ